jgi:Glycine zipper
LIDIHCKSNKFAIGVGIGVAAGAAIGSATHNMGSCVAIGAAAGILIGMIMNRKEPQSGA